MQVKHNYCAVFDYGKDDVITSLKLAEDFNKRHTHILRDIERNIKLWDSVKEHFPTTKSRVVFEKTTYKDAQNRVHAMYNLSRDAVLFMCMNYTGKDAIPFRLMFCFYMDSMSKAIGKAPVDPMEVLKQAQQLTK